ncbi:hypothetical protein K8F61_18420 [Microbacterium resistens]|uniref:SGNH hydrolase-type esterase domain-containing protein n=1 Tax=Microbacterium resistens TaxID=156977 RepID=A0ABY3RRH2_9MICO|nr:GDSL-type esterase/lipase family protein [Microbacterium resistens]UGS26564.1 hypothetical protein K8F61_18420 [Microbacterium resistens]
MMLPPAPKALAASGMLLAFLAAVSNGAPTAPLMGTAPPRPSETQRIAIEADFSATAEDRVPEDQREDVLGPDWRTSDDIAWTLSGDSTALRVLTARESEGYTWTEIAALGTLNLETDRWIGNACMTADKRWLAVVYGPRGFTNDEVLFTRGAFGAVVEVDTGSVTELGRGFSLAYFNPGCGQDDHAVFSAFSDTWATHLTRLSASDPSDRQEVDVADFVTSAIPTSRGIVGATGGELSLIGDDGSTSSLIKTQGQAFDLSLSVDGSLTYLQHDGTQAQAMLVAGDGSGDPTQLADGVLSELGLATAADGSIAILGTPNEVSDGLPSHVMALEGSSVGGTLSADGALFIDTSFATAAPLGSASPAPDATTSTQISARVVETDTQLEFEVDTSDSPSSPSSTSQDEFRRDAPPAMVPDSPVSSGSICAVPRNDPAIQAMQPRPAEVEWAVSQAVQQDLHPSFPRPALAGGGRVPVQIMLGVLAQESNVWQASRYSVPGVPGNPLIGNYYGIDRLSDADDAWWQIDYENADCGYGIAQVTDGMEQGEMPYADQLAIATDYQANIARGLQILIEKWNELHAAGMKINDGNPAYLENWFYALWTYNTGFKAPTPSNDRWGVGWSNNPINPIYAANRGPFLDNSPADAANPQRWPYPEKVLGFAAHSAQFIDSVDQGPLGDTFTYLPAFTPAWWTAADNDNGETFRRQVKPEPDLFCDATNSCDPATAAKCTRADSECWFHFSAEWKEDCSTECGRETLMYDIGEPKPSAAGSYPPNCSVDELPAGALIIDNLPSGSPPTRSGCSPVSSAGTFEFRFAQDAAGLYPSKVDLHQLGSGFNGQFWFTHVRVPDTAEAFGGALDVAGTWTLDQPLNGWARVYVHMPNHGAWTQQASYQIETGVKTTTRIVNQRNYANEWVSLGALPFAGTPRITLANNDAQYADEDLASALSGADDIAWDAVAFEPLPAKPADLIVALGDSYSSGEGTSPGDGSGFFRGSDHHGRKALQDGDPDDPEDSYAPDPNRNACHRSTAAWPYGIEPPNIPGQPARALTAAQDPRLDFHLLACSGAETRHVQSDQVSGSKQRFAERNQLDRGFVDENTTLVTLTIGGNDLGFEEIIKSCVILGTISSPDDCESVGTSTGLSLGEVVADRLSALPDLVSATLNEIRDNAPNARILMLGYPMIFESSGACVSVRSGDLPWLNSVADKLNAALTEAADAAGAHVTYQDPQYLFAGANLCTPDTLINGFMLELTPGDEPLAEWTGLGPNVPAPLSAQSFHPNTAGADRYATVANSALDASSVSLSGTLVGGQPTTYYMTFRVHDGGPVSFNVTGFDSCGGQIRFGLRRNDGIGAIGEQDTETLAWERPHKMQTFMREDAPGDTWLPAGDYALNARLTAPCPGDPEQPWTAVLRW